MFLLTVFLVIMLFPRPYCNHSLLCPISFLFESQEVFFSNFSLPVLFVYIPAVYTCCFNGHVFYSTRLRRTVRKPCDSVPWVLFYRTFCVWIAGFVGLRSSWNRHTATTIIRNLVNHGWETNRGWWGKRLRGRKCIVVRIGVVTEGARAPTDFIHQGHGGASALLLTCGIRLRKAINAKSVFKEA